MDLEVIWNGSHGQRDQDLLCCPKILTKRPPPPIRPVPQFDRGGDTFAQVEAALEHGPGTIEDLITRTTLRRSAVTNAVGRLKRYGVLEVVGQVKTPGRTKPRCVYGLVPIEALA